MGMYEMHIQDVVHRLKTTLHTDEKEIMEFVSVHPITLHQLHGFVAYKGQFPTEEEMKILQEHGIHTLRWLQDQERGQDLPY